MLVRVRPTFGSLGATVEECEQWRKVASWALPATDEERRVAAQNYNAQCRAPGTVSRTAETAQKAIEKGYGKKQVQDVPLREVAPTRAPSQADLDRQAAQEWLSRNPKPSIENFTPLVLPAPSCGPLDGACLECQRRIGAYNRAALENARRAYNRALCTHNCYRNKAAGHPELCLPCDTQYAPVAQPARPQCAGQPVRAFRGGGDWQIPTAEWVGLEPERFTPPPPKQEPPPARQQQQAPPPPEVNPGLTTVANVTRGGLDFFVGDTWKVLIVGATPNQTVEASATKDGVSLGKTVYGKTDASGTFELSGQMASSDVGDWTQVWWVGGKAGGSATFRVRPAPQQTTPPPQEPPPPEVHPGQVAVANVTRGGTDFLVGDIWRVMIAGATPNQTVEASATKDGHSLGKTAYGKTDASGTFELSGQMAASDVGSWTQTWWVGGKPSQPQTIAFQVSAPAQQEPPPEEDEDETAVCPQDAYVCPDGSVIGRTGPNCEFACPAPPPSGDANGAGFEWPALPDWIPSAPVDVGGYEIPSWALLAGGGALAAYMIWGKR